MRFVRFKKPCIAVFCLIYILSVPAHLQAQPVESSSVAAAEIRFQQLEKEVRRLTGHIEEQAYEIRRLRDELAKLTGDLEMRVQGLEQGGNSAAPENATQLQSSSSFQYQPPEGGQALGTITTSANDTDSAAAVSDDPATRAYERAYGFIKMRDFNSAAKGFESFMADYPDHALAANAKYWHGETFYVRGDYEQAARIFAEGYQKYPKGQKAADNLLKLGMALTGMGKKDEACIAYKQLEKDYATAPAPVRKRADTEMDRIDCG